MADRTLRLANGRIAIPAPNLWERSLGAVAPTYAQKIYRTRVAFGAAGGGYAAARRDRRATKEWRYSAGSANSDLVPDLPDLRERSRDLVRNNPLARGAINTAVTSVVGTGLKVRARVDRDTLGLDAKAAREWQRQVERLFRVWAESEACDFSQTEAFADLQDTAFRSALESGDMLVLLRYPDRKGAPFGLAVQLVEGDRLSNPSDARDKPAMIGGVERDPDSGAPLAYHVANAHPGDLATDGRAREWSRIPARDAAGSRQALLLFDRLRADQARGEPYLAPVIETLKQLGTYTEAELSAAVVGAFFTVFIKTATGQGLPPNTGAGAAAETDAATGADEVKLGKGSIVALRTNESIESASPGRPNEAFDPFVLAVLRQIGVALELPYEVLIKHFTTSYSAARASMLEAWRFFKRRRAWLARKFCQPVYEAWLADAVARGLVAAAGFFADPLARAAWCRTLWIGDAPGQIDPTKETEAAEKRMNNLLSSRAEETPALSGRDSEEVLEEIAAERELMAELGIAPVAPAPPGAKTPGEEDETETGEPGDRPKRESAALAAAESAAASARAAHGVAGEVKRELVALVAGVKAFAERPPPSPVVHVAPPAVHVTVAPPAHTVEETYIWDAAGDRIVGSIKRPIVEGSQP